MSTFLAKMQAALITAAVILSGRGELNQQNCNHILNIMAQTELYSFEYMARLPAS